MKNPITNLLLISAALVVGGCGTSQVARKSTVFGMQVQSPAPYQVTLQIGLIRNFDLINPVNSNGVAARFYSNVDADLKPFHQTANETFDTR